MILCSFLFGPHLHVFLTDKHILCFNFTVEASSEHGKSWLNIHCSLDEKLLFEYNNANKANLMGSSGGVNSTKVWKDMTQTLEEMGQEFRKRLLHIRPKTNNTKGKFGMGCRGQDSQPERRREEHRWEGHFRSIRVRIKCQPSMEAPVAVSSEGHTRQGTVPVPRPTEEGLAFRKVMALPRVQDANCVCIFRSSCIASQHVLSM